MFLSHPVMGDMFYKLGVFSLNRTLTDFLWRRWDLNW